MKKLITLIITLLLAFSVFSQYTQNIDSMSRKEIRKYLTSSEYSGTAKDLMYLHNITRELAIAGYGISGTIAIIMLAVDNIPTNDSDGNPSYSVPLIIFGSSLVLTAISELTYSKAIKMHKSQHAQPGSLLLNIRDANLVYNSISQ